MKPDYVRSHLQTLSCALPSVLAIAGIGLAPAWADDINWSNVNGGSFHVGGNWTGGVVPGADDLALFNRTRNPDQQLSYTVTCSSSPSTGGVLVGGDRVTLDLNGNAYLLTNLELVMRVGTSSIASGRLTLIDGVMATITPDAQVEIGGATNAPGFLTISTGAQFLGASVLVGHAGPGTLVVQNGGDLVGGPMFIGAQPPSGGSGIAAVSGAGSAMVVENLSVGNSVMGRLNINSGGRVESTTGDLGTRSGVLGTVNVDGAGSRWTSSGDVNVGYTGQGAMNITGNGRVQGATASAGFIQGSSGAIVINSNGELITQGRCTIGNQGVGTMNVTGGALVQSAFGEIGVIAPGTVTVDGAGSRWMCSQRVSVGAGTGTGTLAITGGAVVQSATGTLARYLGIGSVSIADEGSVWSMSGNLAVGGDVDLLQNGGTGTITIGAGGTLAADRIFLYPHGTVELNGGTLAASSIAIVFGTGGRLPLRSGVLHADVLEFGFQNEGATLAPGLTIGHTTIVGDYVQLPAAALEIEMAGTNSGILFDRVDVVETAFLGGTLNLRFRNDIVPSPNQSYVVLDSARIVGSFGNVASRGRLAVPGRGSFLVSYGAGSTFDETQVVLSNFSACTADFSGDGFVNSQDFFDFLTAFFALAPNADFNHDSFINSQDLFDFLAAFFAGC